jgi:hypothetical protein
MKLSENDKVVSLAAVKQPEGQQDEMLGQEEGQEGQQEGQLEGQPKSENAENETDENTGSSSNVLICGFLRNKLYEENVGLTDDSKEDETKTDDDGEIDNTEN